MPKIRLDECEPCGHLEWRPDAATLRHLTRSLRTCEGAAVEGLCAADGKIYFLRLARDDEGYVLRASGAAECEPSAAIELVLGMTKADQFESVLRACGELGVSRIVPVMCARSVPRSSTAELPRKMSRWNKIIAEATKVSGLSVPPRLEQPTPFADIEWSSLPDRRVAAIIAPASRPLALELAPPPVAIAIGPEGDWTDDEARSLIELGFSPISLGTRVLRASTAAIAAVSAFMLCAGARVPR